jgi:NodT family efflux transporter outer membrane factor (OMF) lipoprotein
MSLIRRRYSKSIDIVTGKAAAGTFRDMKPWMPSAFPFLAKRVCGVLCIALTACSVVPPKQPPDLVIPLHFANATGWMPAKPADNQPRGPWWTVFNDPVLNGLEDRIDVSNQTLRRATAQLEQARSLVQYQRSGLFPTLSANASTVPFHTSANVAGRSLAGKTIPDHVIGISASWEPDLFGRIRATIAQAQANAQASASDLASLRLSMHSDLAVDYVSLRSLDRQIALSQKTADAYAAALKILDTRFNDGAIDASALASAKAQWETAQSLTADLAIQRAGLQHAIATLTGEPASTFSLPASTAEIAIPVIPDTLPSALLQRRPDIAAAQRRIAAANAGIGIATAAYFPDLTLAGTAGFESTFLSPWLSAPSFFWSIGPQLVGTLFDGGARRATLQGANAAYTAEVADYRETVLTSFQQVEDQLNALNGLAVESRSQTSAVQAADLAMHLTQNRYDAGAVDYLNVVTTQTIAFNSENTNEQVHARRLTASVRLIEALGGGWGRPTPGLE